MPADDGPSVDEIAPSSTDRRSSSVRAKERLRRPGYPRQLSATDRRDRALPATPCPALLPYRPRGVHHLYASDALRSLPSFSSHEVVFCLGIASTSSRSLRRQVRHGYLIAPPGKRSIFCRSNIHPGYSGGNWLASSSVLSSVSDSRRLVAAMLSASCSFVFAPTMTLATAG